MLFFIKKSKGKKEPQVEEEKYTKSNVLAAMGRLIDWQFGQKGTELRDQYDADLEAIRREEGGRKRLPS